MQLLRSGRFIALICLLGLGILLATLHKRAVEQNQPFFADTAIRAILSPFQSATHSVVRAGPNLVRSLRSRGALLRQIKTLRKKTLVLEMENAKLREEHAENLRLRSCLEFKERSRQRLCAAQVIARGASQWHKTITINRGQRDGLRRASPIITPRGLVGQVLEAGGGVSQVLLITDQSSGAGALVERSRVSGLCEGQHTGFLIMNYLDKSADINVGDIIVTSGAGGVYPKGIPIGRVTRITSSGEAMKCAEVRPSVDFDRLEEVLALAGKPTE